MKISESCAKCLYDRQRARMPDEDYLEEVRSLLEERGENDSSPLLVYRFNQAYARRFGSADSYAGVKRSYNDLVLSMADHLRAQIEASDDPLAAALAYARVGNYIDFGAMDTVDEATFLGLFKEAVLRPEEKSVYERFLNIIQITAVGENRDYDILHTLLPRFLDQRCRSKTISRHFRPEVRIVAQVIVHVIYDIDVTFHRPNLSIRFCILAFVISIRLPITLLA